MTTDALRVLTLNLWGPYDEWSRRAEILRAGIDRLAPHLVTLQETVTTPDRDQAQEILGEGWTVVHQRSRETDGSGITTATRFPVENSFEVDLHVSERTSDIACTTLVCEGRAPEPWGRIWLVNHFPDYQPSHEVERERQAVRAARCLEGLLLSRPGHVVVAGDFDADPDAAGLRFWTGRQSLDGLSVCYRDAWEGMHGAGSPGGDTYVPDNPWSDDWDWPFRRIDHVLVRCDSHGGPTLRVDGCQRVFDGEHDTASDHYGLLTDLVPPPPHPRSLTEPRPSDMTRKSGGTEE